MLYIQDIVVNSDILDEYGLINRAQSKLNDESISSVEQAIEKLESKTSLHEQWIPVENSDRIRKQVKNLLAMGFDFALGKYIGDQAEGMNPIAVGLSDLIFSRDKSFAEKNADDVIQFYETARSHSLNSAIDIWIDQNYLNAVGKVVTWSEIVNIYVENAIEPIHSELPDMDLSKLRSYLIAHINEVQSGWPHYNQIIETLKENDEPQVLDEKDIHEQVRLAFEDNMRYMDWDEEHFQRGTGKSISTFIDEVTYCILAGYDEIDENQVEEETDYQMREFENDIKYEYINDIDEQFEKYAQEHDFDEYSLSPAEDVDAINSDKLSEWADNIELFIQDNYPELLENEKNKNELADLVGDFQFAFFSPNVDFDDTENLFEELYTYDSVDDFIEDFQEDLIANIEVVEDEFSEWLVDNNEDYADETPVNAYQKFMENPDWNLYIQFIKTEAHDFESLTWAVGWTDEFYYSKSELLQALSY